MNKLVFSLVVGFGLLQASAADLTWHTGQEFSKAQKQAKAENKQILIDFTGSDW